MHEIQAELEETETRYKKRNDSVNSRRVTSGPDSASDSTPPSQSHVIFTIQPLKAPLLLQGLWLKY